jgi:hypothetical protein
MGVAVLATALAMLRSRLFPAWLHWLGVAAGLVICVDGVIAGPAFAAGGGCRQSPESSRLPAGSRATMLLLFVRARGPPSDTGGFARQAAGRRVSAAPR